MYTAIADAVLGRAPARGKHVVPASTRPSHPACADVAGWKPLPQTTLCRMSSSASFHSASCSPKRPRKQRTGKNPTTYRTSWDRTSTGITGGPCRPICRRLRTVCRRTLAARLGPLHAGMRRRLRGTPVQRTTEHHQQDHTPPGHRRTAAGWNHHAAGTNLAGVAASAGLDRQHQPGLCRLRPQRPASAPRRGQRPRRRQDRGGQRAASSLGSDPDAFTTVEPLSLWETTAIVAYTTSADWIRGIVTLAAPPIVAQELLNPARALDIFHHPSGAGRKSQPSPVP